MMMTDLRSEYFAAVGHGSVLRLLLECVWIFSTFGEVSKAQASHVQYGIVYGEIAGQRLTMDYYPGAREGPHPAAIIIHGGGYTGGTSQNGSEAYCADFLAPAGYAVFSINYRLAPEFPLSAMVADVQRSVRFIRYNASRWNIDARRIALVGGSAGGYLSNMAGLLPGHGDAHVSDSIDPGQHPFSGAPRRMGCHVLRSDHRCR
jgi:acetyl esterase/lipase